jgi:Flp pilus assembly protein CpaB
MAHLEETLGRVTQAALSAGQVVRQTDLVPLGRTKPTLWVPAGHCAMAFPLDYRSPPLQAFAPHTRVDIIATFPPGYARIVGSNLLVLATSSPAGEGQTAAATASVEAQAAAARERPPGHRPPPAPASSTGHVILAVPAQDASRLAIASAAAETRLTIHGELSTALR